ncbi:hypothetical protein BT69DRAFT_1306937 [Atractiella rhizophila]|nr:hypothetical protein BT69DRAFT_1306937 [Atractiella rhizophila]
MPTLLPGPPFSPIGDGGNKVAERLKPTHTQLVTIYVIAGYSVFILIAWNLWGLRHLLYPFKLLVVAFHEFSHAAVGCCTGARIESITLDPNEGGATRMRGGIQCCTLPAGYLGSSLIGALLIFAGFNIVASKIASIALGVGLIIVLFWARNWLTRGVVVAAAGLLVAFWFINHAEPLRFLVLFIGVMSCLYSVWDILDDLVFRKVNESDASQFAKLCPVIPSRVWGLLVSIIFLGAGILGGLAAFKQSAEEQKEDSEDFLPTRLLMSLMR